MNVTYEEQTEKAPFTPEMEAAMRKIVVDRAPGELAQLANATSEADQFTHLPSAAAAAFHLERFAEAKQLAVRALALAPAYEKNWNYGNAIHIGHTVLGLLALNAEDHSSAIAELHQSGETPGSPQLNSFGPTMQLAKALLRHGHVEPVVAYLGQCRVFWESGATWLEIWERKIREGQVPNFFQHSYV
jgi:hypothetical protein